jgi:hypothetical protein
MLGILWGAGVFAILGVGPFLAAWPITAMHAGLGAGTTTGAVISALVGIGIPEFDAKQYEHRLKAGLTLGAVHCENSAEIEPAKQNFLSRTPPQKMVQPMKRSWMEPGLCTQSALRALVPLE